MDVPLGAGTTASPARATSIAVAFLGSVADARVVALRVSPKCTIHPGPGAMVVEKPRNLRDSVEYIFVPGSTPDQPSSFGSLGYPRCQAMQARHKSPRVQVFSA